MRSFHVLGVGVRVWVWDFGVAVAHGVDVDVVRCSGLRVIGPTPGLGFSEQGFRLLSRAFVLRVPG